MEQLSEAKTSQGCLSLRNVLRVRLLFGFYSAINARANMSVFARLYCLCFACIITTAILIIVIRRSFAIQFVLNIVIEYGINVFISLLTGENHFFNFCKIIEQVDIEMGFAGLALITPVAQNMFMFIFVVRLLNFVIFWVIILKMDLNWLFFMSTLVKIALSLNSIINIIMLDLLRQRFIVLRRALKHSLNRHDLSITHVRHQIKAINDSLVLYKTLIDIFNAEFAWNKLQIVANFVSSFLSFMLYVYLAVDPLAVNIPSAFCMALEFLSICLFACLTPIFIELVIREVDKLKVVIGNRLIGCDEIQLSRELEMASEYLENRPFKVSILRVLTLDGSFVLTFTGICITYLIILIQTTGII